MKSTIAVLLGLLLALTACGSKEQPGGAQKNEKGDMVKFAQCMRDNGVDMPDPKESDNGAGIAIQAPGDGAPDMEKMNAAHEACKQHLPNGGEFKPPSPEEQDKMRQNAKCMRDRGHNWPDPKFEGGGMTESIEMPDMEDEKVKQDMKDCGMGEGMVATRPIG
ncbi:hypothetical protein SAMN04488074_14020 [Lentzea albidocapillata subsp. violacea]|uniref:PT repeat-containing protein n=1 Tax=Lentzea albidocapillata subsp. violacea TaxID=128104 RepID=A0A1G9ZK39_9PSEU|nr:hypothetical protein [Lentzea albidocapillata]SDN21668.1 hypothetical protein SAMN04488074_14020 [Lentzea albidocapillata subsp. violacea]